MKGDMSMETLVKIAIAIVLAVVVILFITIVVPSLSGNLGEFTKLLRF